MNALNHSSHIKLQILYKLHQRERGYVLHLSFYLLIILTVSAIQLSSSVLTETRVTALHGISSQANYTSESGLEWAWWHTFQNRPASASFSLTRSWAKNSGTFSGGNLSLSVTGTENTTNGSTTCGDLTITSTGNVPGYGVYNGHTFSQRYQAILPNLANDTDSNAATSPVASASSSQVTRLPASANDNQSATYWASTGTAAEWLEINLGSSQKIRKVVLTYPDARVTSYSVQTFQGGSWTTVSNASETVDTSVPSRRKVGVVFDTVTASRIRVLFNSATNAIQVYQFKVYPPAWSATLKDLSI